MSIGYCRRGQEAFSTGLLDRPAPIIAPGLPTNLASVAASIFCQVLSLFQHHVPAQSRRSTSICLRRTLSRCHARTSGDRNRPTRGLRTIPNLYQSSETCHRPHCSRWKWSRSSLEFTARPQRSHQNTVRWARSRWRSKRHPGFPLSLTPTFLPKVTTG